MPEIKIPPLRIFFVQEIKSEVTVEESRFDFKCEQDGVSYYVEVKGVPNATAQDPPPQYNKKKKNEEGAQDSRQTSNLIAFFPDGYRKSLNDPIRWVRKKQEHPTTLNLFSRELSI